MQPLGGFARKEVMSKSILRRLSLQIESRDEYIIRMARIAIKRNWTQSDYEWLANFSDFAKSCINEIKNAAQQNVQRTGLESPAQKSLFTAEVNSTAKVSGAKRPAR